MTGPAQAMEHSPPRVINKSHDLDLARIHALLGEISSPHFWQSLAPGSTITGEPFGAASPSGALASDEGSRYVMRLCEDGYFQTPPRVDATTLDEMLRCVDAVMRQGLPPIFALVYDVFYRACASFHPALVAVLGERYRLIPNFWVYHIAPSEEDRGFEPHRDAEYCDTIRPDGLPTVITAWIAITEATPLNGCMYILPRGRDPEYAAAVHDLQKGATRYAVQDVRAVPALPGTMSCWNQYVFHWGSRSSKWSPWPRVSYAMYFQRGDVPPVDRSALAVPSAISFEKRLGIILRGILRYSFVGLGQSTGAERIIEFARTYTSLLG